MKMTISMFLTYMERLFLQAESEGLESVFITTNEHGTEKGYNKGFIRMCKAMLPSQEAFEDNIAILLDDLFKVSGKFNRKVQVIIDDGTAETMINTENFKEFIQERVKECYHD